jgi:hypothetical protein
VQLSHIIHREVREEREESMRRSYVMLPRFASAQGAAIGSTDFPSFFALFAPFAVNNPVWQRPVQIPRATIGPPFPVRVLGCRISSSVTADTAVL